MLRKDFDKTMRLFQIDNSKIKFKHEPIKGYYYNDTFLGKDSLEMANNYHLIIKDKINWESVRNVLNNLQYCSGSHYMSRIDTQEGVTIINSITEEQYNSLKNFNIEHLGKDLNISDKTMTLYEYNTLKTIYNFVIPKMIKNAEIYFINEYETLYQ